MKIAHILGSLDCGGTETLLLDVFRNTDNRQPNAIIIYRKQGSLETYFRNCGMPIFYLSADSDRITYILRLRKLLRQQNITIVHAHQFIDAFLALIACTKTQICTIQTIHSFDYLASNRMKLLIQFTLIFCAKNIFVSHFQRNHYLVKYKLKPEKQAVVYNGISFDRLNLFVRNSMRDELGLNPSTVLLGSVGNFNVGRDQLTLCRFANLLKDESVDFHLLFIGKRVKNDVAKFDNCVTYCKENNLLPFVTFLGSRDDVPNILNQLDAFIYASDHDTFGIAVVEAMATGVPVFVNDWEVMREITENGKHATLYETKDINDLKAKFDAFLGDKEHFKELAIRDALYVRKRFNIHNHIQNLHILYNSLSSDALIFRNSL